MIDIGVYYLNYKPEEIFDIFLNNPVSEKFQKGDPFTIWGKSGTEIAFEITNKDIGKYKEKLEQTGLKLHRSPEYWAGWSLAYYQWYSNKTFRQINNKIPFEQIVHLYFPYHEMDIRQFCDKMDSYFTKERESKIKKTFEIK